MMTTHRLLGAAALVALALAGCASDPQTPKPPSIEARYGAGGNIVQVTVTDRLPLRGAELVAPNGTAEAARSINTERLARSYAAPGYGPTVGVGVGGFSGSSGRSGFGTGLGLGFPLGGFGSGPATESELAAQVVSNAFIPVADAEAYRASWRQWRVRLSLGAAGVDERVVEVEAPPPPG